MKHLYPKVFFSAFIVFLLGMLPVLVVSGGRYMSMGDYNVQSLIFSEHINRLFRSKDGFPLWDWQSDLGMDTLVAYSSFMLSPFALILFAVPTELVPYVNTIVTALKIGLSAVFACGYCRGYVKKDSSAYICGMLYAFSGFQLFNMCYQFADTICFFPLTILCFDELVTKKRPGAFAVMLALNGYINGYFLWEECVFLLIYYIVKTVKGVFPRLDLKLFMRLAAETLGGVAMSAASLLPSGLNILGNPRAGDLIFDTDLLAYEDDGVILNIIESLFFPSSIPTYGWYFESRQLALSPPALFIPLFTVIGVTAIIKRNKGKWENLMLAVCAVFACVPLFNSVFSMFNASYYSRWFYMPLMIMIMMTGRYIDDMENINVDRELKINGVVLCILAVFGIYYVYFQKDFGAPIKDMWLMCFVTAAVCLGIMYVLAHPNKDLSILRKKNLGRIVCAVCCVLLLERSVYTVRHNFGRYIPDSITSTWNENVPVDLEDDSFFRITSIDSDSMNTSLIWGYPDTELFNSMVTGEETNFYELLGIKRFQSNNMKNTDYPVLSFLSVKYWFHYNEPTENEDRIDLNYVYMDHESFDDMRVYNRYLVYENSAFIPMGYTFDYYLDINTIKRNNDSAFMDIDDEIEPQEYEKFKRLLLKAIWLDDEQAKRYSDILSPLPEELAEDISEEAYYEDCKNRAASACYEFIPSGSGFDAFIDLEKDNLVFFSIPCIDGFTAYVDGKETDIEEVFGGLSAVYVPRGDHKISFVYDSPGLKTGCIISIVSAALIFIYSAADIILKKAKKKTKEGNL
ncbi:MAG: YfhO family protein [Oscillospiraceae bacterium]|nr:YfhO family protein [Oscillospiraceae bacterium]